MSLIAIGLFQNVGPDLSWAGYFYNLIWVTLGNTLAGAVILAGAYHCMAQGKLPFKSYDVAQNTTAAININAEYPRLMTICSDCLMPKLHSQCLVPIRESYGGDVSEPLGELTKHPLLGLLELYKRGVELLD